MAKYKVETETKGTLFFDELPKRTYFLGGYQNEADKGKATYFTFDNGTCLIPIIDTKTGLQVIDISKAGTEIN
jgi:hypothetical protein